MYFSQREIARELALHGKETSLLTLMDYLSAITNSKLVRKMPLYDTKKEKEINTKQKYFFIDCGLRNSLMRETSKKRENLLQNLVYTELLKAGYEVQ